MQKMSQTGDDSIFSCGRQINDAPLLLTQGMVCDELCGRPAHFNRFSKYPPEMWSADADLWNRMGAKWT